VTEQEVAGRVAELEQELAPLIRDAYNAFWELNVTGEERWQEESARLDTEIRTVLSRPDRYRFLLEARENGIQEPLLRRQVELLVNAHRPNQLPHESIERIVRLEKEVEASFNTFRAELDGERVSDNRIRELLLESDDVELRRRAWEASKQIGSEVEERLLELVRERNAAAASLGFPSYYRLMLEVQEQDEDELFALLDRVEEGTRGIFEDYKANLDAELAERFGVEPGDLRPWHYGDPFFQEGPTAGVDLDGWFHGTSLEDLSVRFYDAVGFDARPLLERSDLYEREGKCQHAFCIWMDRADDIRILCNLQPTEYWANTILHELGHAVYDAHIDRSLPYFLRDSAHTLTTEASAMLFGRLSRNAAWLTRYAGVPEDEARQAGAALAEATRASLLVSARWELVMCHFERALYRDPGQDLNRLWWDLVERLQLVRRPEGRDAPDWAAKIHFSVSPVYYHNYLLGEMMASQLQAHIVESVLGGGDDVWERYVSSPAVGEHLKQRLYRSGASLDWRATIEQATGRPLDPGPFVAELAGGG
jgi:peptidyl-dipeptidase A